MEAIFSRICQPAKWNILKKKLEDDGFPGQDGLLLWRGQFIKRSRTFQETIFSFLSTLKDARKNSYSL